MSLLKNLPLLFFFICLTCLTEVAWAGPLREVSGGRPFIGGRAPAITSMPVTKEFKKDNKVLYKVKALVKRASEDTNGRVTLLTKKGTALETFFQIALPKSPLRKIPALKMNMDYTISVAGKGTNSKKGRRPNGPRRFVEPLEFGLAPDTYRVTLGVCGELADHPVASAVTLKKALDIIEGLGSLVGVGFQPFLANRHLKK